LFIYSGNNLKKWHKKKYWTIYCFYWIKWRCWRSNTFI